MGIVSIEWISSGKVFLVREMPIDMVSFAVSTGVGVSVVAGILSGVCYMVAYGSQRKRNRRPTRNLHCDVCGEYFRSIDHILGGDSIVTCSNCQSKVCQKRCAKKEGDGWSCKNCLRPPETWLQGILHTLQPNKKGKRKNSMDSPIDTIIDQDITKTKEQVQDFLEQLVNSMLGHNVDDANVSRLYNDENYLPVTGEQSPCTAHAALKHLIEKLLREALNLPELQKSQSNVAISSDLKNGTYEDLLATAILNKVIANSQNGLPSSSAASMSSRLSTSSNLKEGKEYFFGEETLENKWKHADIETTSVSSLEDWLQSDSSFGSRKYVDKLTLTIKQDIEEVSQISESEGEDEDDNDSEYFKTRSSIWSDDEPNWFLQKRQFQGTHSPVPVPMLVPNPTTEAKVLIGDKEIDETSDLSDVESEYGEAEIVPARHSLLINSKTIIGGKNDVQNGGESESDTSGDSGVKEVDRDQSGYDDSEFMENPDRGDEGDIFESKADITVDDDNIEDASILSVYSNTEQEAEYTEQYASLPRKIEKRPQAPSRPSLEKNRIGLIKCGNEDEMDGKKYEKDSDEEVKRVQMHFSGTYSRREKEKWKNAIEMKNNPYSKENIEKRIKRSNSGVGSMFGPDYYARMASSPSGTKSKTPEVKDLSWRPQKQEKEESFRADHRSEDKHVSKTYLAAEEDNGKTYTAKAVIVEPENDFSTVNQETHHRKTNDVTDTTEKPPVYVAEVTSDSDLSYVNCYDVENAQVYKKSTDKTANSKFQKNRKVITKKAERTPSLKRHKSESDLLIDYQDVPRVIARKKDNTLISKIYKSLSKTDLSDQIAFRTQLSAPSGVSYNRSKDYIYGSQEALSSNNSLEINNNNTMTMTKKMSLSSEDDHSDHNSFYSEYRPIRNVYSSNEDLLSIDSDRGKKKDNTLITKIYQQSNVRNYAMARRENVPEKDNPVREAPKVVNSEDDVFVEETIRTPDEQIQTPVQKTKTQMANGYRRSSEEDLDVHEIGKKKIVHNILERISRSEAKFEQQDHKGGMNGDEIRTSVKDLMKKFENNISENKLVSSLTARSLSRHTRKTLRN